MSALVHKRSLRPAFVRLVAELFGFFERIENAQARLFFNQSFDRVAPANYRKSK